MAINISQCLKHHSAQNTADYFASSVGSILHCQRCSPENIPHMTSVQNIPHCIMTSLENIPHCLTTNLENIPHCLTTNLENIPHCIMTSLENIPHCLTSNLENIPHCIMTSLENIPLCLATDMLWTFSCALPNSAKQGHWDMMLGWTQNLVFSFVDLEFKIVWATDLFLS
jgi:uncharacterized membrane protein